MLRERERESNTCPLGLTSSWLPKKPVVAAAWHNVFGPHAFLFKKVGKFHQNLLLNNNMNSTARTQTMHRIACHAACTQLLALPTFLKERCGGSSLAEISYIRND
jgi:hypothetical protein